MNIIFNKFNFIVTVYVFIKLEVIFIFFRFVIRFIDFLRILFSLGILILRRFVFR